MPFPKLTKEEIEKLKIVDGFKLHRDCIFLIVEAPGRSYSFDIYNKDRRYLAGIVFTYPIGLQKAMWRYVIKNFILPKEREKWIKEMSDWLEQIKLDENILP